MCIFPTVQNRRWFLLSGEEFVNMYQNLKSDHLKEIFCLLSKMTMRTMY